MSRLLEIMLSRRGAWAVVAVSLLVAGLVLGGLGQAERDADALDSLPAGFESTQGAEILKELPDEGNKAAIVLFTVEDESIMERLPELSALMEEVAPDSAEAPEGDAATPAGDEESATGGPPAGVDTEGATGGPPAGVDTEGATGGPPAGVDTEGATGGPPPGMLDGAFPVIPAEDGTAAFSVLDVDAPTSVDARDVVAELRDALAEGVPDGVTAEVTGPAAIEADLASVFDGANFTLLAVTASVVAVLLIVTYRSPILWIVPLTVVGIADQVAATTATHVLKAVGVPWDDSTIGILSVLVFGAGTNYALLLISRYRDELRTHESRFEAMRVALARASEAIVASAGTVVVGVLSLMLSVFPSTRGLGLACAVGILVAMVAVLVVLPAALVIFPRWIFWPQVPKEGQDKLADSRSVWRRIGDAVAKRPAAFAGGSLVVLLLMAAGITQIKSGLDQEEQFLETPQAITAAQRLAESFPAGASDPLLVVTRTDDQGVVDAIAEEIEGIDGVNQVTALEPEAGVGQVQVVLDAEPGSDESVEAVEAIRAAVGTESPSGVEAHLTGGDASVADANDGAVRDRFVVMPVILAAVLIALMLLLRSVLAPILLLTTVVVTYSAALGISWFIFTGIMGFSAIDATLPLLSFVFLVALGIDYNIFLITRTLEEAKVRGTRDGVLRALGATGGVITSAGILLAAVFAVLGVLPLVVLAQIGVVICIGVLLDTLVVRTVVVPAIVRILGEPFWWPRKVDSASPPRHSEDYVEAL
ncbi:MMPL family transporter [Ornithinimicrobium panacihumi]|uniref:MMPL family transporter n=1 Tax=Ornithinimicrobium panacihumi TaxID=2008449 RepID=UPI003F8C618B